jgi:general secretion pathway protein I
VAQSTGTDAARRQSGFSLIEVLVALAIFAVLASTIAFQTGAFGAQLFRLEEKSIALWLAQNALDEARIAVDSGNTDELAGDDEVEMAGRSWIVLREFADTAVGGFRRIDVSVSLEGEEGTLLTLTGFVGER